MARRALLAALLVLAGCKQLLGLDDPVVVDATSGVPTEDGWLSGARLKLRWNDYDGTRQFVGVFDSARSEVCTPVPWSDGNVYCTPASGNIGFTDAGCTNRIGIRLHLMSACAVVPAYFSRLDVPPCGLARRSLLFKRGAQLANTPYYTLDSAGVCNGPFTNANYDMYSLDAQVLTSDLVELAPATVPMGRLEQHVYAGADGTSLPYEIYDTTLATACTLSSTGTCAPSNISQAGFGDSGCTESLAAGLHGCPAPAYGVKVRRPNCPASDADYFTLGAITTANPLYQRDSTNACIAFTPSTGYDYYHQGSLVTPATLARSVDTVPGRQIQLIHFVDADTSLRGGLLFDTTHQVECSTLGGRCLPSDASVIDAFADSMCNTPVKVADVYSGPPTCGSPPAPRYALYASQADGGCDPMYQLYKVGALRSAALFQKNGMVCEPITIGGAVLYDLQGQVSDTELATATMVTDP